MIKGLSYILRLSDILLYKEREDLEVGEGVDYKFGGFGVYAR